MTEERRGGGRNSGEKRVHARHGIFRESAGSSRAGAGVNNIPLDECASCGIVVFNTPGANANGVKELVLAGMLLAARDVAGGMNWCRENAGNENISKDMEKAKKAFAGNEIKGKKLGVIGLGAIGAEVANAAAGLGMEVLGYDPFISVNAAGCFPGTCATSPTWTQSTASATTLPSMCRFWIYQRHD